MCFYAVIHFTPPILWGNFSEKNKVASELQDGKNIDKKTWLNKYLQKILLFFPDRYKQYPGI